MHRLEHGMFLRLERAAGAQIRLLSGRVWITESGRPEDVFLCSGQSYDIVGPGRVVVEPQAGLATLTISREAASAKAHRSCFDVHRTASPERN
ncbi:DUF2917 domain-containing protein [Thiomonas intermedia]|uniref:DUF2917 domain-containing protein n=1 Tax=Thiomonas intermedia TaxID=926 RepID=UPI0014741293|nr:DUF2917 domain-containing protein [Thiomonas intermedia]